MKHEMRKKNNYGEKIFFIQKICSDIVDILHEIKLIFANDDVSIIFQ
jgi:hypothetical protein